MDQALPMQTVYDYHNRPYVSVIDDGLTVRVQLHQYDNIHPIYLTLDKRALPELINILEQHVE